MKNKFSKFINLQGKYLTSLLILLTLGIGQIWAVDPDYESYDWNSADAMTAGLAGNTSVSISVVTSGSDGNVSGHWYKALNSAIDGSNATLGTYLSISSASQIDSVEIFFCPNGTNATNLAWAGWGKNVTPSAEVGANYGATANITSSKSWANATWQKIDLSSKSVYTIYISRQGKKLKNSGSNIDNFGANQTVNLLGLRVWLHKYTVTINPDGGSTSTEGWTLSEGKYLKYVASGTSVTLPTMSKGGNTFAGWKNKNNEDVTSPITITKDTVLTAQWTPSGGTTHDITYTNLKGSDVSSYPTEYYEGTGIASFAALADVTDFHFNGWSPASIAADATTDQTISATWVDAYNVTFALGSGASGTAPAGFQKWEGAKFNLPGQGSMTAPSGKVFDGWKASSTKYAANAEYTMGNAAVEFVAQWKNAPQTIFDWTAATTNDIEADNTDLSNASYGTLTTGTSVAGRMFGTNTMAKNGSGYKLANNDVCIEIEGTVAFAEGDTVVITGKNGGSGDRCFSVAPSTTTDAVADTVLTNTIGSQTDNSIYKVVIKSAQAGAKLRVFRKAGSTMYLKAIKVIRPAAREIASTVITLSDVKVNGRSISSDSLAILKTASAYELTLKDAFASAPEIKFNEHTVITYADGESPATKETDKVYTVTATEVSSQWQAQQTIDGITYTVKAPKVSSATVTYYDGATKLGEEVVAVGGYATASEITTTREHYAFDGWYNDAGLSDGPVTLASTVINADKDFYGSWTENAKAAVTFQVDGAQYGDVQNVYVGDKVASVDSPTKAGNVFRGWYNGESKFDFTAAIASGTAITLDAKWAAADANHYVYAYNDDFHYDGVVYKTPEGTVDEGSGTSNIAMTTPYTLFAGAEGITSIVMTDGIYDSKTGAIQAVTALMKVNNNATSKLTVTIKSGYTATLKIKASGYSATRTISVSDATPASGTTTGQAVTSGAMSVSGIGELSFAINSGSHDLTVTGGTLYIAELDIEATALPAHTVTYMPGEGSGAEFIIDDDATEVSDGSTMFTAPEGKIFHGWKDALNNDVAVGTIVEADMTLTAQWIGHYAVTFNMQGHGAAIAAQDIEEGSKAVKPADPSEIGYDFGGWFTDAECTAGNEFDFNTAITVATPLYAKWTEFGGCTLLYPATSGAALNVGDNIDLQSGSKGGSIQVVSMKTAESSIAYDARGLLMGGGSADIISVTLNNDMDIDTKISVTLDAKAGSRARGLYLLNGTGGSVKGGTLLGWDTPGDDVAEGEIETFSYTVEDADGLAGTNVFRLKRQNSTYIKCIKVESCGAAVVYHNLTSAILPDNDPAYATVTLGASSVREGLTTTAEYSAIDPAYEFVSWSVSGAGASIDNATANPATITVGTEDAVVTLNLQLIPVKFTVNYYDGTTPMGTELVPVNENPTASEIETAKRGYVFEGWAETDGGSVVALNTITSDVAATINLYAVYTEIPCPTEGTVFSMVVTDPAGTEYNGNNEFNLEIGATYVGGKAYSGSKNSTKRVGVINANGEYSFENAGDVTVKIAMDCALQEGDVITFTTSTTRELKIQKVAGTDLVTTSGKKYVIPAASPLIGVYDFYLERGNSQSTMKTFNVTRPYTVSFEMQGHGDAIEAQKLIAGDKVVEPTAPTATGWDFKGWYKESACTNAWDFENDVVAGTMALYAKWDVHVTNDATLKSLKYGSEAIALEDGVFEYNIGLPAMTVAVPALAAVANSATVHSLDIADATAFDSEGKATSTVTVVSEDETVTNVYSVNFSKLAELPQVNVTEATTWNFSAGGSTTLTNQSDVVLANVPGINNDENFNSQALLGSFNKLEGTYFQGSKLSFTTEVAGKLTITFRGTNGNTRHLQVCVGDGETVVADWIYNSSSTSQTKTVFVPVGKVTLKAFEGETPNNARIYSMELNTTPDYSRDVTEGRYGTICLPNGGVMVGAMLYEVAYFGETSQKIFFDNIPSGEMEAGIPYVFLPNDGVSQLAVYYTDDANASATNRNGLYGSYSKTELPSDGSCYILLNNQYCQVLSAENYVGANKAYFKLGDITPTEPALAPGRHRIALGGQGSEVATGMENINADEAPMKVMINGKLFILFGDKMYDATGRLVK